MRTKSEEKRQSILAIAAEIFSELGYERTSMTKISERVGGSKRTLYNYFQSKEELFVEIVIAASESQFQLNEATLDLKDPDLPGVLKRFGVNLLSHLYSPDVLAARRLAFAEASRSDLGKRCYEMGQNRGEAMLAGFLEKAMARGLLRPATPRVAAAHFGALLQAEIHDQFFLNVIDVIDQEEFRSVTERAVDVFMIAYVSQALPAKPAV